MKLAVFNKKVKFRFKLDNSYLCFLVKDMIDLNKL